MADEMKCENGESIDNVENAKENTAIGADEAPEKTVAEEIKENSEETSETIEEAVKEEKKETYAFRWEYSEQTINDKSREDQKRSRREKGILAYAIIMTVAFLLAFSILAVSLSLDNFGSWFAPAADETLSTTDIVDIGMPSTIAVFSSRGDGTGSMGSGFALTDTGYIMTNYHVVDNAETIWLMDSNYREYAAILVGYDDVLDIAVLYAENASFTPVTIGNSETVKLGEEVVAIGCPNGDELLFSVSNGIISGKNRAFGEGREMLQTNAPLNPGNSGGPLFDSNGYVVGVVTSKLTSTTVDNGKEIALEGIAFAVPINDAMALAEELIAEDLKKPMLGVGGISVEAVNTYFFSHETGFRYPYHEIDGKKYYIDEYGNQLEITDDMLEDGIGIIIHADATGVAIISITPGLGADGVLQVGDIITEVDGVAVTTTAEVKAVFSRFVPGDSVDVTYYRDGKKNETKMILKTKSEMIDAQKNQ